MAQSLPFDRIRTALRGFVAWLDRYGETSYDFQSFFAGSLGRGAKALYYRKPLLGTLAVAPMVLCEAVIPARRPFFLGAQRFPLPGAHYPMRLASLSPDFR